LELNFADKIADIEALVIRLNAEIVKYNGLIHDNKEEDGVQGMSW
jgi:hypothetical protein